MMRIQLMSNEAKKPVPVSDDSYDLFSCEIKTIAAGDSSWVSLGYAIVVPPGFYPMVASGPLSASHNIETSSFASIHNPTYKFSNGEAKAAPLQILLRNFGKMDFTVTPNLVVGRLILVRIKVLGMKEVTDVNERDNVETAKPTFAPKVKALPKTSRIWFQRIYKEDPISVTQKFISNTVQASLASFRETPEYEEVVNKSLAEVSFIWKQLTAAEKAKIQTEFTKIQSAAYNAKDSDEGANDISTVEVEDE
jgi:dUTPase